jgi:hypothetical protein
MNRKVAQTIATALVLMVFALLGAHIQHRADQAAQHRVLAAVVAGKSMGIDSGTYRCSAIPAQDAGVYVTRSGHRVWMAS